MGGVTIRVRGHMDTRYCDQMPYILSPPCTNHPRPNNWHTPTKKYSCTKHSSLVWHSCSYPNVYCALRWSPLLLPTFDPFHLNDNMLFQLRCNENEGGWDIAQFHDIQWLDEEICRNLTEILRKNKSLYRKKPTPYFYWKRGFLHNCMERFPIGHDFTCMTVSRWLLSAGSVAQWV